MRPGTLAYRVTKAAVAVGAFGAVGAGYNSMVSQRATAFDTMRKAMEEQQKIVPAMDIAAINWGSSVTTLHGLLNLTREVDGTLPVLTDAQLKQVKESMKALCSPWQTAPKLRFWTPLHDVLGTCQGIAFAFAPDDEGEDTRLAVVMFDNKARRLSWTQALQQWAMEMWDAPAPLDKFVYGTDAEVHAGVAALNSTIAKELSSSVDVLRLMHPSSTVTVAVMGRNLGAAFAALNSMALAANPEVTRVTLYTEGCPLIFSKQACAFLESLRTEPVVNRVTRVARKVHHTAVQDADEKPQPLQKWRWWWPWRSGSSETVEQPPAPRPMSRLVVHHVVHCKDPVPFSGSFHSYAEGCLIGDPEAVKYGWWLGLPLRLTPDPSPLYSATRGPAAWAALTKLQQHSFTRYAREASPDHKALREAKVQDAEAILTARGVLAKTPAASAIAAPVPPAARVAPAAPVAPVAPAAFVARAARAAPVAPAAPAAPVAPVPLAAFVARAARAAPAAPAAPVAPTLQLLCTRTTGLQVQKVPQCVPAQVDWYLVPKDSNGRKSDELVGIMTYAYGGSEHVEVLTPNTDLVRRWMPPARTFQGPFVKAWNEQQEIYRWVSAASQATRNARATRVKKPAQDKVTALTATAPSVPLVDQHERPLIINFSGTK